MNPLARIQQTAQDPIHIDFAASDEAIDAYCPMKRELLHAGDAGDRHLHQASNPTQADK